MVIASFVLLYLYAGLSCLLLIKQFHDSHLVDVGLDSSRGSVLYFLMMAYFVYVWPFLIPVWAYTKARGLCQH
jgi:hypothetical protein